ncbi:MAG: SRPBCC family protein [Thermosynechococcaceae cyanobacterium MS004]|nr:SRPBCC family protein [Thermosynechococcaceae cyanobacterium MS004]
MIAVPAAPSKIQRNADPLDNPIDNPIAESTPLNLAALLQGEILLSTRPHSAFGGAVTAQMYLPLVRSQIWSQITNYANWVHYFPDITRSEILEQNLELPHRGHRLYQAAQKTFLMFTAQVDVYLRVFENMQRQIRFRMERGSFNDFTAQITLDDCGDGTVLTYSVEATPTIPVPSLFIEQAMRQDLPGNMRQMRQVLCAHQHQAA